MTDGKRLMPMIAASLCAILLVTETVSAHVGSHAEPTSTEFAIPASSLAEALNKFGKQTGIQIVYAPNLARGVKSRELNGRHTVEEALRKLLEGTGLTWDYVNATTVVLRKSPTISSASPADQMRVAMLDAEGRGKQVGEGNGDANSHQVVVEAQRDQPAPFSTANLDLTRTEDDVLPFQVFDARDIELSGASNLQEFLQMRLPQNFTSEILDETGGTGENPINYTGQVYMRGWDAEETVFLLNGRRMPAHHQRSYVDRVNATPDLRGIPLASIERIEVLTSAGSAIYGANATGGVINIITRQDFRGGQIAVNYESPADIHAPRRSIDLNYGIPLKRGFGLRVGASYSDYEPLRAGDRADVSVMRWRRLALERDPGRLINYRNGDPYLANVTPWVGATPNIMAMGSTATDANDLFPHIPGVQNFTTVPAGSAGNLPLSDYQPGVWSMDLAEGVSGGNTAPLALQARGSTLGTANAYTTLSVAIDKALSERWRWSFDARRTESESEGRAVGLLRFQGTNSLAGGSRDLLPRIPATAPTNPFGKDIMLYMIDPNLDRPELRSRPRNTSWDVSSTLHGRIGGWHGFLDVSYGHNANRHFQLDFHEPYGGWTEALLSGDYNPFVDTRVVSPAEPHFYENYIARRSVHYSATRTYQSMVKLSGPLFRFPAGRMQLTVGLDGRRTHRYRAEHFNRYEDGMTGEPRIPVGQSSSVLRDVDDWSLHYKFDSYAAYAETTVPVLSDIQGFRLIENLELFASGRMDSNVRRGFRNSSPPSPIRYTHTSYLIAYGVRYEPLEGVVLRASQSTGFRPPQLLQTMPEPNPPTADIGNVYDPVRDEYVSILKSMYATGGNPDLEPETTDSVNFGLILRPRWLTGTRLSVDYLHSIRHDALASFGANVTGAQQAIELEGDKPGLVYRAPSDGHPSGVGPVSFLNLRYTNLFRMESKSVDIALTQELRNVFGGQLTLTSAVTRNISFKIQSSLSSPPVEQIRNVNSSSYRHIEWNGNVRLQWQRANWSFGWSTRYFDYMLVSPSYHALQGGDRVPRVFEHDMTIGYRSAGMTSSSLMSSLFAGSSITLGVKNVFDREPRFWARDTQRGIAPYDSITGRSIWFSLRKDFSN